jgi:hypothetical protein
MKTLLTTCLLTLASAALAAPSFAQDLSTYSQETAQAEASESGWSHVTMNIVWTGSGVKREYRGKAMPMETIYSGDKTTPGNVAFTCYAGTLSANVAFDPVDMKALVRNRPRTKRAKLRRPDMKIDGEFVKTADWIYVPKFKVYRARKRPPAAKLYNSVIRGSDVEMRPQGDDYMALNLPPPDRVFKNFGAECGMGLSAKKS